ncbi:hypothetical protein PLESTB_000172500 [Pleodorina starrii]|uniref:Uncharacterized protein n=1 Tax=Pleodorina starrii TaxID=330485 RepID=A0A9W6BBI9_9CHLO|nr:hypothetical protein PLESTM_000524400 [Pleodorina starrii]GLC49008.1 hypothetical protein PLESTB_000172500 [Pleodorina starrii]GLC66197.1 hypothetical protein PLESTF_000395400 [Pleodorina starrii]
MSEQPEEQPSRSPRRAGRGNVESLDEDAQQQDVWTELFGIVNGLSETVGLALQAFTPSDDKAVSAITKKRLALRSIHGLKQSQNGIETLLEHLKALQAASQTWQRSMMYASKSHQELMEQIESTTEELHKNNERLRAVEAQRLAAVREAESLKARAEQQEAVLKEARSNLKHKEEELETLLFSVHELQSSSSVAHQNLDRVRQAAAEADERARAAAAALDDAKAEAAKAQGLAERHQQVVAKLTADNLVFLMQLKKAEADLAAANQERAQLRLAAEQQRGPWFDQVRAGVEERVRQAMQHSQELEVRMERREAEHGARMEAMQAQQSKLEEQLNAARQHAQELQERLESAVGSRQSAENLSASAEAAAREARKELDNLAAENRVLQDSIRSMRQECTERWVNEQAAVGRVDGLEQRIEELQQRLSQQTAQLAALQRQLDTQAGINRQLMARKEEVEWQLMAAMAKVDGGAADQPVPLNLQVSGLLQVAGPNQHQRNNAGTAAPAAYSPGRLAASAGTERAGGAATGSHSASRSASTGGAETRQQAAPGSGLPAGSGGALPHQYAPHGPRSPPLYQRAGDGEPSPTSSRGNPYASDVARRAAVAARTSGTGAGSPARAPRPDAAGPPMGRAGSVMMPEPSLLIAHDDLVTITHAPIGDARGDLAASARRGVADPQLPAPPQLSRGVAGAGLRNDAGFTGGASSVAGAPASLGLDATARWISLEVASTVVSSPPNSVALSTDPGSPGGALSHMPSDIIVTRGPAPHAAAVTIRTVSTGQWRPGGARASADIGGSARAGDASSGRGPQAADGAMIPHPQTGPGGDEGGYRLERRGSLHDGDDVWLPHVPSSSSSDDSDFLFAGGVAVHRESHVGEPRNVQTPAQQAQLYQLQQRLQVHLQVPAAAAAGAEAGGALRLRPDQGPDARGGGGGPQWQASSSGGVAEAAHRHNDNDSNDDVIRVRAPLQRGGDGGGVVIRPAIGMRTAPTQPAPAGRGPEVFNSRPIGGQPRDDRIDAGAGVFSISKGGAQLQAPARPGGTPMHPALSGRPGGSPVHPALSGRPGGSPVHPALSGRPGAAAPHAASLAGSPKSVPPSGSFGPAAAMAEAFSQAEGATADAARPFLRESGGGAPSDTDPIPVRVQAGPPFFATGAPLDGSAVVALQRWTLSAGGGEAAPRAPAQPHFPLQPEGPVPLSPERSTASLRCPLSPPHPAIIVIGDRGAAGAANIVGGSSSPAAATDGLRDGLGSSARAAAAELPAGGALQASAAIRASAQASRLQGQVVSTSSPDEDAAAEAPTGPPARPRVFFHGLMEGDGSIGTGHTRASSLSSSTGSLIQGGGSGGGAQAPSQRTSSGKSVRFSEHDPEDDGAQLAPRRSLEQPGAGFAMRTRLKTPAFHLSQDAVGRSLSQRTSIESETGGDQEIPEKQHHALVSGVVEGSQYRSRGPVLHPAMLGVSAVAALDAAEATPSKRHSAAGVATTVVPRASSGSG